MSGVVCVESPLSLTFEKNGEVVEIFLTMKRRSLKYEAKLSVMCSVSWRIWWMMEWPGRKLNCLIRVIWISASAVFNRNRIISSESLPREDRIRMG